MTIERNDNASTEFGLWIRKQKDVDSYKGFRAYNIDFVWWFKKGYDKEPTAWMLLEEKRYNSKLRPDQHLTYEWLHKKISKLKDKTYKGFHLIQFEKTNPEDGKIFLNKKEINKVELIEFLKMNFEYPIKSIPLLSLLGGRHDSF